jgi:hypothetical protein
MNCIAKSTYLLVTALSCCVACGVPATEAVSSGDPMAYSIRYLLTPRPGLESVDVSMHVRQSRYLLREVRFKNESRLSNIRVDGKAVDATDEIVWRPSESGGTLQWSVQIKHRRGGDGYDAWLGDEWGIFRAEDVIPRAATRTLRGALSNTTLQFDVPSDWTTVTAYASDGDHYAIDKPQRRFDQPDGWIAIGHLGVRRETIAGMRVAVAGPIGHSLRRMDILALLNWTLPELARVLPEMPRRLTIISAANPMWRGGLSAPKSLYIHADRPLISENSTSTMLHEVMHSTLRLSAAEGYDWIVEGVAEFYSLELLRRSGTISESRFAKALDQQRSWSNSADKLCRHSSQAATTALAVVTLSALSDEIRDRSAGEASLDDLVRALHQYDDAIDLSTLQAIAAQLSGDKSDVLDTDKLPGCRSIEPDSQETS